MLKVGVYDNFSRTHWARKRDIRKVKKSLEEKFGDTPYVPLEKRREQ